MNETYLKDNIKEKNYAVRLVEEALANVKKSNAIWLLRLTNKFKECLWYSINLQITLLDSTELFYI